MPLQFNDRGLEPKSVWQASRQANPDCQNPSEIANRLKSNSVKAAEMEVDTQSGEYECNEIYSSQGSQHEYHESPLHLVGLFGETERSLIQQIISAMITFRLLLLVPVLFTRYWPLLSSAPGTTTPLRRERGTLLTAARRSLMQARWPAQPHRPSGAADRIPVADLPCCR
jgi:hypothetical protein